MFDKKNSRKKTQCCFHENCSTIVQCTAQHGTVVFAQFNVENDEYAQCLPLLREQRKKKKSTFFFAPYDTCSVHTLQFPLALNFRLQFWHFIHDVEMKCCEVCKYFIYLCIHICIYQIHTVEILFDSHSKNEMCTARVILCVCVCVKIHSHWYQVGKYSLRMSLRQQTVILIKFSLITNKLYTVTQIDTA